MMHEVQSLMNLVNGRIKRWRYFSNVIQNSSIPSVGDNLRIICAIINAYQNTPNIDNEEGERWTDQMLKLLHRANQLQKRLELMASSKNKPKWKKYDATMVLFPELSEEDVRNICFGEF